MKQKNEEFVKDIEKKVWSYLFETGIRRKKSTILR